MSQRGHASRALPRWVLLGLGGLVLSGCGQAARTTRAAPATTATTRVPAVATRGSVDAPRLAARISYPDGAPNPPFTLLDQKRRTVSTHVLFGTPYALVFVSTKCARLCQATLSRLRTATREARTRVILISTTPHQDTPKRVSAMLEKFGLDTPNVSYASHPTRRVARTIRTRGFSQNAVSRPRILLIDQHGKLRAQYPAGFNPADLAHDAKILANEAT